MNYYNDNNPECVAWLEQLIAEKLIPYGYVDGRSITEVEASDLEGFTQCHFFAGIGGWPLALRLAGIQDTERIDTASLPCQPFSGAGLRLGESDPRHLWPHFFKSILGKRNPPRIVGEQVASKDGRDWLARVRIDLEALGYAVGASDLCAAGAGAPHIRQRLFWGGVDNALFGDVRLAHATGEQTYPANPSRLYSELVGHCGTGGLEHAEGDGRQPRRPQSSGRGLASGCGDGRLGNSDDTGPQGWVLRRDGSGKRSAREASLGFWGSGEISTSSSVGTRKSEGLALNPLFSLWLQGYRPEWGYCGAQGILSSRKSRRSSSKPSTK